jgi:hypothetical protein
MTKLLSTLIAIVAGVSLLTAVAPSANACGFLGCIVNQIAPGVGDQMDNLNRDLGHPAEQILNGILNGDDDED